VAGIRQDPTDLGLVGGGGVDSVSSEQEQVAGSCEYGDKPSGSGATELIGWLVTPVLFLNYFLFQISTRLIHM
jgi:hypothetical protein